MSTVITKSLPDVSTTSRSELVALELPRIVSTPVDWFSTVCAVANCSGSLMV